MKRYADIYRPLSIRRSKVVCSPCGVTDEKCGLLVCIQASRSSEFHVVDDARTDVDVLLLEDAFELVPHARHRFPIPVLGTRRKHAERHIWQLLRARQSTSEQTRRGVPRSQ